MEHKLVLTRQTEEFVEWKCPTCKKHVRVKFEGGLETLNPGDQSVKHDAVLTMPGLDVSVAGDLVELGNTH